MGMVLRRLRDISGDSAERPLLARLAVPSSAVSVIIGHQGAIVKRLSAEMGCR